MFRNRDTMIRRPRLARLFLPAMIAVAGSPGHAEPAAALASSCDRTCLTGFMDQFLDAVVAHDPRRIEKAVTVRYTEEGQELALGDGLWGTASARGSYRHYFPDPQTGTIGFFGTMRENGHPVLLAARLGVVDRKIAEIETIVAREQSPMLANGIKRLEDARRPDPIWDTDVPAEAHLPRADLMRIANRYFTGLERNRPNGDYSFFADDCDRLENGAETTNAQPAAGGPAPAGEGARVMRLGCRAQFSTGFFQMVTRIRDRRFVAVDEQKGVVFAFAFFDHAGRLHQETLADGRTVPVDLKAPFTWEIAEGFKIDNGHIRRIEAVLNHSPYAMKPGWPERDLGYDPRTGPR